MRIALFASKKVGYEVTRFFAENKEPLACLVLDSKDNDALKAKITTDSGVPKDKIFQSDILYSNQTIKTFQEMKLDLIILAWWPYIIKESIIQIPRIGCLNFHPSYLPYNRGKHYNFWSLVEDVPFGVSLHFADNGVDTGDICFQSVIEKSWEDTGKTLYFKAEQEIVRLFKENFHEIKNGHIPRQPQNLKQGSFHKAEELESSSQIILEKKYAARELLNLLRAKTFPPYPGAWFIDKGERYEVRIEIKKVD